MSRGGRLAALPLRLFGIRVYREDRGDQVVTVGRYSPRASKYAARAMQGTAQRMAQQGEVRHEVREVPTGVAGDVLVIETFRDANGTTMEYRHWRKR